jgi:hypothetical protein
MVIDLLGISNNMDLLANGKIDPTDVIGPGLKVSKLYDVNARGEVLEYDVSHLSEAVFQAEDHEWKVAIETEIDGLKSSFEAKLNPESGMISTTGSVWGYVLEGTRGRNY